MAIEAQMYAENLGFPMFGSQSQPQDLMVDNNGCGGFGAGFNQFCFNAQQKPPQLLYQPPPMIPGTLVPAPHNNNYMAYTRQTIAAQEAKQRQEIDEYIRLQVRTHFSSTVF